MQEVFSSVRLHISHAALGAIARYAHSHLFADKTEGGNFVFCKIEKNYSRVLGKRTTETFDCTMIEYMI